MLKKVFFILILLLTVSSCDENLIMSETTHFENEQWNIESPAVFSINPPDSINDYNLFINLRNTGVYEYNNLYLISQIKFPHGKTVTDTLEYIMANPDGSFLGSGTRDVFENKLWLKEGVRFRESGKYELILRHAMRQNGKVRGIENLKGVLDVGYSIEKQVVKDGNE